MPLYQNSVLKTYLAQQDKELVAKAYNKFTKYFHNPTRQQNIREIKEEGFQQKFLMELFVTVFGYVINPDPNYNLTTEFKNEKGAKKADGAILKEGKALGVIELKSTKLKDLEKIRQQAFDYKANQSECVYVITSNFEKLRFYINNAVEFEEFDLFTLSEERFQLLYLCLEKNNILNNVPLAIKQASTQEEKNITDDFYKKYSLFKRELFRDLVKKNMKNEVFRTELNNEDAENGAKNIKRTLFKKSQKLIDRFLFIFFAEDSTLLTSNSSKLILDKWKSDNDFGDERPLYDLFKQYFHFLDTGRKGTESRAEIFAYNGGLFKPDPVLDSLVIDDGLLNKHIYILQKYDFESKVDVNILGHIFENSLNEIESVNAEIDGVVFDKQKTKRKKDGVFYTPKYITKYIVDNTVGKLCSEKKTELKIVEDEYRPKRQNETKKRLLNALEIYREWLLQITILDPACGSGAFLNQALDFLIKEHQYLDELQTKLLGGGFVFPNIENTVLENNIYGVDLNEESVEIAKLSLWLRTAQPRRKLNNLNSNIKCGNSLIDSKAIAGDKAFKWATEFIDVFKNGGFDVIIGNPPYVQSHSLDEKTKEYIYKNFLSAEYQINTYAIFVEKILNLLRKDSYYSIIIPNYWLSTQYDSRLRKLVFLENNCTEILNVFSVFEDATVDTVILTGKKNNKTFPKETLVIALDQNLKNIEQRLSAIDSKNWALSKTVEFENIDADTLISFENKLELNGEKTLGDYFIFKKGMQPYEKGKGKPEQTREMMNNRVYHSSTRIDDTYKPLLKARNVQRFYRNETSGFIKYGPNLAASRNIDIFKGSRILINRILSKNTIDGFYLEDEYINNSDVFNLIPRTSTVNVKALSVFVLSKLCATFFRKENVNLSRAAFPKINVNTLERFPIPKLNDDEVIVLEKYADEIASKIEVFVNKQNTFCKYLQSQFSIEKLPKKLQNWHELVFAEFMSELNKAIKKVGGEKLTKLDEIEWMDVFETKKAEAQILKVNIDKIDREIDKMVYELYGLSKEEIIIVENN